MIETGGGTDATVVAPLRAPRERKMHAHEAAVLGVACIKTRSKYHSSHRVMPSDQPHPILCVLRILDHRRRRGGGDRRGQLGQENEPGAVHVRRRRRQGRQDQIHRAGQPVSRVGRYILQIQLYNYFR